MTEVQMMLSAFSNMETVHIAAYSHLLDTIGMDEAEYQAFMKYKEMKDKYDYMRNWGVETKEDIATTLQCSVLLRKVYSFCLFCYFTEFFFPRLIK